MKFEIPKITKILSAGEYAPELEAVKICVWVNPPRALLNRHDAVMRRLVAAVEMETTKGTTGTKEEGSGFVREVEAISGELCAVFAEFWSAGSDPETHWTADEVDRLITGMVDTDPQLWPWLRVRTLGMIREHRETAKKD